MRAATRRLKKTRTRRPHLSRARTSARLNMPWRRTLAAAFSSFRSAAALAASSSRALRFFSTFSGTKLTQGEGWGGREGEQQGRGAAAGNSAGLQHAGRGTATCAADPRGRPQAPSRRAQGPAHAAMHKANTGEQRRVTHEVADDILGTRNNCAMIGNNLLCCVFFFFFFFFFFFLGKFLPKIFWIPFFLCIVFS